MLTPEQALEKAKQVAGELREVTNHDGTKRLQILGDTEAVHSQLDDLLCEILRPLGYGELVDFFQKLEMWYS
jgi:hypothetical protein